MPSRTILVVDDTESVRTAFRTVLQTYGYEVVESDGGSEALRLAAEKKPDLILLDLMMPGMDGWTANERLKAQPATANIPVAAISACDAPEFWRRAEREGFVAFIGKPVLLSNLITTLERLFPKSSAA